MPTPGIYANLLESLLREQGLDSALCGKIANTIEYGLVDLDRIYQLVDEMLATDAPGTLLDTLISYYEQMAEDSDTWQPTTADLYRSADEYQQMLREHPALELACYYLDRLITQFMASYYSR